MKNTIYHLEIVCLTATNNGTFMKADTCIKNIFDLFGFAGKCEYHIQYDDRTDAARKYEKNIIKKINSGKIK
jgi:hypothetical protein